MSREIKRMPLDFGWVGTRKVWEGYITPDRSEENPCPDCKNGYSVYAQDLFDLWYGYRFEQWYSPASTAPWIHHLTQEDVDALVAGGRLKAFTHTWSRDGRRKIEPPVVPAAARVNEWSLRSDGHDCIDVSVVIRARCERANEPYVCATCGGHGSLEAYEGQRVEAEAWERTATPVPPELSEDEIRAAVARCPEQQRPAFEGWLRGTHHLDGELITEGGGLR